MATKLLNANAESTLSTKGQLIIPKSIREHHNWDAGQKFTIELKDGGIFYKPKSLFPETTLEDVAGALSDLYDGPPKTLEDMEKGIEQGIKEVWGDHG